MSTSTLLMIIGAAIAALGFAIFQYFYKAKHKTSRNKLYALLRFFTVFGLLVLLINPKYTQTSYTTVKPTLAVLIDNSASVKHLGYDDEVEDAIVRFRESEPLNSAFDVQYFKFGTDIESLDSLSFSERQTNIAKSLKSLSDIYKNDIAPVVLLSDGNQTLGQAYTYTTKNYEQAIYPLVVGDTIVYDDLRLGQVNVNRYAYINNTFPVEIFASYNGTSDIESRLTIRSGGNPVYQERVNFSPRNPSKVFNIQLPATSVGVRQYQISLSSISNEKNVSNNRKNFAIEVIDQKTKVLLVSNLVHPDLGVLKKSIESNRLRSVDFASTEEAVGKMNDYELVILYQPDQKFAAIYDELTSLSKNVMTITGIQTDWRFLNTVQNSFSQEITGQSEDIQGIVNRNYSPFLLEDIGFSDFPPLATAFGETIINTNHDIVLFKKVGNINTDAPLLVTMDQDNRREVVLLGEGLWRWRAQSYLDERSFEKFDNFIGNLVQFSASTKRKSRLNIDYDSFYYGNGAVQLYAQYFDKNYIFDARASLTVRVKNTETGSTYEAPFLLQKSTYRVDLSNLEPGSYSFTATVKDQGIARSGTFTIVPYEVEQQFLNADVTSLTTVATHTSGSVHTVGNTGDLFQNLLNTTTYKPIQKSSEKSVPLIDWQWLLATLVLLLAIEWFMRKYHGLI